MRTRCECFPPMRPTLQSPIGLPPPSPDRFLPINSLCRCESPPPTANPEDLRGVGLEDGWGSRREELERSSEGVARRLEIPDDDFQVPVNESLWFSNNPQVENDYLGLGQNRLVGYLPKLDTDHEVILLGTQSVLSRDPSEDELAAMTNYLGERSDRRPQAVRHVVWALLGTPEFRFNH